jgi:hypothetical protein
MALAEHPLYVKCVSKCAQFACEGQGGHDALNTQLP